MDLKQSKKNCLRKRYQKINNCAYQTLPAKLGNVSYNDSRNTEHIKSCIEILLCKLRPI